MRKLLVYILFFIAWVVKAQDKVYLQDGTHFLCKITEISNEKITYQKSGETLTVDRLEVVVIEFKNGLTEIITPPGENTVYNPNNSKGNNKSAVYQKQNYFSVNTLSLVNADIAGFYEYLEKNKRFGFGFMGAYNFNVNATLTNAFIAILANSKKNYDLGVTLNYYPGRMSRKANFYMGTMIKYTDFSFRKEARDSTYINGVLVVNVNYSSAKGSQLATLFHVGSHINITEHFFIKSFLGVGAFRLKGDYKEQINIEFNKNRRSGTSPENRNFLGKMYIGLNIGYNF